MHSVCFCIHPRGGLNIYSQDNKISLKLDKYLPLGSSWNEIIQEFPCFILHFIHLLVSVLLGHPWIGWTQHFLRYCILVKVSSRDDMNSRKQRTDYFLGRWNFSVRKYAISNKTENISGWSQHILWIVMSSVIGKGIQPQLILVHINRNQLSWFMHVTNS